MLPQPFRWGRPATCRDARVWYRYGCRVSPDPRYVALREADFRFRIYQWTTRIFPPPDCMCSLCRSYPGPPPGSERVFIAEAKVAVCRLQHISVMKRYVHRLLRRRRCSRPKCDTFCAISVWITCRVLALFAALAVPQSRRLLPKTRISAGSEAARPSFVPGFTKPLLYQLS
jgi:hypothetical protein